MSREFHISVSGTQFGMSLRQQEMFHQLMTGALLRCHALEQTLHFHHGDCVGVDEQAARDVHHIRRLGPDPRSVVVESHPGIDKHGNSPKRAYVPADVEHKPLPYLQRNIVMVKAANQTIIIPKGYREERFGGTWHSFRHAREEQMRRRESGHLVYVIWPDGVEERLDYTTKWHGGRR